MPRSTRRLRFFQDDLGDLDMAFRRLVERRGYDLALDRALHVGDFFRPLVDKKHDQHHFGIVGRYAVGDLLQQHGLAAVRLRHDQAALAFAYRASEGP